MTLAHVIPAYLGWTVFVFGILIRTCRVKGDNNV